MNIAIAMFLGRHFQKTSLVVLPVLALVSFTGFVSFFILLALFLINFFSSKNLIISNIIFYVISNLGCWLFWYPITVKGFAVCYLSALPFAFMAIVISGIVNYLLEFVYQKNVIKALH